MIKLNKKYWLEHDKTNFFITSSLLSERQKELPKQYRVEISKNRWYHNFYFNNKINDNESHKFISQINDMQDNFSGLDIYKLLFDTNFRKIYSDEIKHRILIIHALFSIKRSAYQFPNENDLEDILNGDKCVFLEQLPKSKNINNSIRIFHFLRYEKDFDSKIEKLNITLYPLFIDTKHQIIPYIMKDISKCKNFIKLMVKNKITMVDDLRNNFANIDWRKQNHDDIKEIIGFQTYQNPSERAKFIRMNKKLSDFIDWLFENYNLIKK